MHRIGHNLPRCSLHPLGHLSSSPSIGRPLGTDASASPPEGTTSLALLVRRRVDWTSFPLQRRKHREGNIGLLLPRLQTGDADSDSPIVMRVGGDENHNEENDKTMSK
jgi:hypothetical protein